MMHSSEVESKKIKKMAWITSAGLVETDIHVVPELAKDYSIDWYIIKEVYESLEFEDELNKLAAIESLEINIIRLSGKRLGLGRLRAYRNILQCFNKYDLVYTTIIGVPYYIPTLRRHVDRKKVIVAAHNVTLPKGVTHVVIKSLYQKYAYLSFFMFDTFSKSQCDLLKKMLPNKKVFYTPFMLKDYGNPQKNGRDKRITFLCYGTIKEYKRHDVVIRAAENLYKKGLDNFKVIIAGAGDYWKECEPLIHSKELFDLRIYRIKNEDVPDVFNESDYLVLPYQGIAQSGAAIVGVNYELPIIASNLEAFREYIEDGVNGYLIDPANQNALEEVMEKCILEYEDNYDFLHKSMRDTKESKFSAEAVLQAYKNMIENANV